MGRLVVIEGMDGSGKSTQFEMLCERLSAEGRDFMRVRFPRYDKPSSVFAKMYLMGEFGDNPDAVNVYAASSFYAVDRFASFMQDWRGYYEDGGFVLTDRYTTSNALHQGAKLAPEYRERFFRWLYEYEFDLMGLPAPDMVIYLDVSAEIATSRLHERQSETSTAGDIHERDVSHLEQCSSCGAQAAQIYGWKKISCAEGGREKTAAEINAEIYELVAGYL